MASGRREKPRSGADPTVTLIDELLAGQRQLTAVERFSKHHDHTGLNPGEKVYRRLLPARAPGPGEQFAFEVNLDKCSGCKACVSACHSLNGLEEGETWRGVGLLLGRNGGYNGDGESANRRTGEEKPCSGSPILRLADSPIPALQHVTTACHHCVDPGCLNGCPVLAYDKDPLTGIVSHLDDQCIGCTYCVMKCPYEVPKYSSRLGIVRKCDLCANRLAVGEAPACVQGCPNEAIRITVVKQDEIVESFKRSNVEPAADSPIRRPADSAAWLPDAPDPAITLPTTRYVSKRGLPADLAAADHGALRLDHPHWPLVFMLVLTQSAAGIFLATEAVRWGHPGLKTGGLMLAALVLLCAGLAGSVLHLGRPLKAWRAFLGWRRSWLSREIIAFNLFAAAASAAVAAELLPFLQAAPWPGAFAIFATLAGLGAVFTSVMVYVDTSRPFWAPRLTLGNFFGTAFLLGATFTAALLAWGNAAPAATKAAALAALAMRTLLFAWRRLELRTAWRDPENPRHFNARVIRGLLPWVLPVGSWLFAASTLGGLLAVANALNASAWWASAAALATLSSEIIWRHVFFVASAAKRMPGGIAP